MDKLRQLIEQYPAKIAIGLLAGLICFLVLVWMLRIRLGFPAILFGCLLLLLSGSSRITYLQILSKGAFRWVALAAVGATALLYFPRGGLRINRRTPCTGAG